MASVSIEKLNLGKVVAIGLHNYRLHQNYSNKDIDLTKSNLNVNLVPEIKTERQQRKKLKKRVEEIDTILPPQRRMKDRVVAISYEVAAPRANMSYEDSILFLTEAYKALEEYFGKENMISGVIHADEVHQYVDPVTKTIETSRVHLHAIGVPFVEGKGVNGKLFLQRKTYNEVNAVLDAVCVRLFGYKYRDGSKQKSNGSVEELKAKTFMVQLKLAKRASQETEKAKRELEELEKHKQESAKNVQNLTFEQEALENEINAKKCEIAKITQELQSVLKLTQAAKEVLKEEAKVNKASNLQYFQKQGMQLEELINEFEELEEEFLKN